MTATGLWRSIARVERKGDTPDPNLSLDGALHEVSNALTVLLGWIAEARTPDAERSDIEHALRIVEHRARAARDLARRAIGANVARSGEAALDEVLSGVSESLALELSRKNHTLVRLGDAAGVRIPTGEDVAQIVTNLALNAMAYAPEGSAIRVKVKVTPTHVEVDVADDGPGVSRERHDSVFEGDTTRVGGAGVGLRHARAMARAAGGDLALVQAAAGATFRLTWPRAFSSEPARARSMPKLPVLGGARVLVLEDDSDVTGLLESALSARGALVTLAHTRHELEARLEATHDAILVDLSPIAADVKGAMALVARQAPNAAIVFITGSAESLPEGLEGVWVRKPFEVSEIVTALLRARGASPESGPVLPAATPAEGTPKTRASNGA